MYYKAVKIEDDLPPMGSIVTILIGSRIPMIAQIRPSEKGPEWWTLGMSNATRIEEHKKCVTHWLKKENVKIWVDKVAPILRDLISNKYSIGKACELIEKKINEP